MPVTNTQKNVVILTNGVAQVYTMYESHKLSVINSGDAVHEVMSTVATTPDAYSAVMERYEKHFTAVHYTPDHLRGDELNLHAYFQIPDGTFGHISADEHTLAMMFGARTLSKLNAHFRFLDNYEGFDDDEDGEDDTAGQVFVLCATASGLQAHPLGYAEVPVDWGNYDPAVVELVKQGIRDLNTDTPRGRMLILEGPPGTGKTYLVRGLVGEIKNAPFIIVPTDLVSKLGDPQFMAFMLKFKEANEFNGPLVLLVEDADQCLIKRESGELSGVSSILNLSDGILGEMMDIRVVATTNALTTDFDPAILRKGRLSAHVKLTALNTIQCNQIYQRLVDTTEDAKPFCTSAKLTEVYDKAYAAGWRPMTKAERQEKYEQRLKAIEERNAKPSVLKSYKPASTHR